MNVLIVNTSELTGGAAVAANRLMKALRNSGVKVKMMVRQKQTDNPNVVAVGSKFGNFLRFCYERLVIFLNNRLSRRNLFAVSIANTGINITKTREFREADVIHLHWINQGMLSLNNIRQILDSGKPVVWTMHDMWPATAICHHAYECSHYETECKNCPFLHFPSRHDLSNRIWKRKKQLLHSGQTVHFVAVSEWLASLARKSLITGNQPVTMIHNTLELSKYNLLDQEQSRKTLGITSRYVIVFGAARIDAPIKGFNYLLDALQIVVERGNIHRDDLHLITFGEIADNQAFSRIPVHHTHLGYVNDSDIFSAIYSAANAVVSSSLYETFGQTLIEGQACGCVPVSFAGSGQADIIRHLDNGFLAERLSADSLADGIEWALTSPHDRQALRNDIANRYSDHIIAAQYTALYETLN